MLGFEYNEFEIKKRFYSDSFYNIYKDGDLFSTLALSTVAVAKRILDRVYPDNKNALLVPILKPFQPTEENYTIEICRCGCGKEFKKNPRYNQVYKNGHNNATYYRKLKRKK